jgi:hypothetical protein
MRPVPPTPAVVAQLRAAWVGKFGIYAVDHWFPLDKSNVIRVWTRQDAQAKRVVPSCFLGHDVMVVNPDATCDVFAMDPRTRVWRSTRERCHASRPLHGFGAGPDPIGGLVPVPGAVYRARILVKWPRGVSESKVLSGLKDNGFARIRLFKKDSLPADWPADQRKDEGAWTGWTWTAYLEGTYDPSLIVPGADSVAGSSDLELLGFWLNSHPATPPVAAGPPPPPAAVARTEFRTDGLYHVIDNTAWYSNVLLPALAGPVGQIMVSGGAVGTWVSPAPGQETGRAWAEKHAAMGHVIVARTGDGPSFMLGAVTKADAERLAGSSESDVAVLDLFQPGMTPGTKLWIAAGSAVLGYVIVNRLRKKHVR